MRSDPFLGVTPLTASARALRLSGLILAPRGPNLRIVLIWVRDEGEGPTTVKDRRLGTDRRRSRQRTVVVSDVSYATVYLVRHALAGIERAT